MLREVDERGLQQRVVDRVAVAGIAVTLLAATALVGLDPVQVVSRTRPNPAPPLPAAVPAKVAAAAPAEPSPLRRLRLPSQTWQVASDGRLAAFVRVTESGASEIVVGGLDGETWRVAHRTGERRALGQLSLANGVLAFEEFDSGTNEPTAAVYALRLDTGRWTVVDEYPIPQPEGAGNGQTLTSAAPVTDGSQVYWVRADEIRGIDLATGEQRSLTHVDGSVPALFAWRDRIAFTSLRDGEAATANVLDLRTGAVRRLDGFTYAFVQAIGPAGVAVLASESETAPLAVWLVAPDGTRTRIGADCIVAMSARVLATRCGPRLLIRDLATGRTLTQQSAQVGMPAVYDRGAVWSEGAELVVYDLPALPGDDLLTAP